MNTEPHTHELQIRSDKYYYFKVQYGDTHVRLTRWFKRTPSDKRVRRAARKAIRKHDKGTLKAERASKAHIAKEFNDVLTVTKTTHVGGGYTFQVPLTQWGVALLNGQVSDVGAAESRPSR